LRSPDPRMIQNFRQDRCDYWDSVGYEREWGNSGVKRMHFDAWKIF
jgi:hypothetical protein